jgi:PAS domain S-box-containing protein
MERALHSAEKKYQGIFENAMEGIFLSTVDGALIDINPAFARMFGYSSRTEMLRTVTSAGDYIYRHPEMRKKLLDHILKFGKIERFEGEAVRKNKETFWITASAQLIYNESEQISHIEGTIEDITERKIAEEALRESEARFRLFTQLSPDGIVVHSEGKILFLNSKMLEIGGASD